MSGQIHAFLDFMLPLQFWLPLVNSNNDRFYFQAISLSTVECDLKVSIKFVIAKFSYNGALDFCHIHSISFV